MISDFEMEDEAPLVPVKYGNFQILVEPEFAKIANENAKDFQNCESKPNSNANVNINGASTVNRRQKKSEWSSCLLAFFLSFSLTLVIFVALDMFILESGNSISTAASLQARFDRIDKMLLDKKFNYTKFNLTGLSYDLNKSLTYALVLTHLKRNDLANATNRLEKKMDEMELPLSMIDPKDPKYDGLLNKTQLVYSDALNSENDIYLTFKEANQRLLNEIWRKYEEIWGWYERLKTIFASHEKVIQKIRKMYDVLVVNDMLLRGESVTPFLKLKKGQTEDDLLEMRLTSDEMQESASHLLQVQTDFYQKFNVDFKYLDVLFDEMMEKISIMQEIAKDYS